MELLISRTFRQDIDERLQDYCDKQGKQRVLHTTVAAL